MINRSIRPLALLAASVRRLPGARRWLGACDGHAYSARYCYGVWLRHFTLINAHIPVHAAYRRIAELGPGPSLGTLIAALLSGAEQAVALDVTRHATAAELNYHLVTKIAALLSQFAPIPRADDRGDVIRPLLEHDAFPANVPGLKQTLSSLDDRVATVRAMLDGRCPGLRYVAPWKDASVIEPNSIDLIFSQAVMEHVDDLAGTYAACRQWLRRGGLMSHQIDFRCHGTARHWNGHYTLSDGIWRYMERARPYLLNREPPSTHTRLMEANGFEIVATLRTREPSVFRTADLAPRFHELADEDLSTSGMYVLARRLC